MTNTFPAEDQTRQATEKAATPKLTSKKKGVNSTKAAAKKTVRKAADSKEAKKAKPKSAKHQKLAKQTKKPAAKPKSVKPPKAEKPKKPKLVRDSFTMPALEYALLAQVKKACISSGFDIKKSELLRIGVAQLATMDTKKLKAAQAVLTPLRAGRPKKSK
jgi:hypothetical protein